MEGGSSDLMRYRIVCSSFFFGREQHSVQHSLSCCKQLCGHCGTPLFPHKNVAPVSFFMVFIRGTQTQEPLIGSKLDRSLLGGTQTGLGPAALCDALPRHVWLMWLIVPPPQCFFCWLLLWKCNLLLHMAQTPGSGVRLNEWSGSLLPF